MGLQTIGSLDIRFTATDASGPGVAKAKEGIDSLGKAAEKTGQRMKSSFGGAFQALLAFNTIKMIGRSVAGALVPAVEFSDSMARLRALADAGGFTGGMDELADKTTALGKRLAFDLGTPLNDTVVALTDLSKAGIAGQAGLVAVENGAKLALIAGGNLKSMTDVTLTMTKAWGFEGDELTFRLNQLASAANQSKLDFSELNDVITRSAGGVQVARPSFEDFLFVLTATRDVAQSASVSGTQVSRAYDVLAVKTDQLAAALGRPIRTTKGGVMDIGEIMFEAAASGTENMARFENEINRMLTDTLGVAGARAAKPLLALLAKARKEITAAGGDVEVARTNFFKLRTSLADAGGAMDALVEKMQADNMANLVDRMVAGVDVLKISFGPSLLRPLVSLIEGMIRLSEVVSEAVDGFGRFRKEWPVLDKILMFFSKLALYRIGVVALVAGVKATFLLLQRATEFAAGGQAKNALATSNHTTKLAIHKRMIASIAGEWGRAGLAQRGYNIAQMGGGVGVRAAGAGRAAAAGTGAAVLGAAGAARGAGAAAGVARSVSGLGGTLKGLVFGIGFLGKRLLAFAGPLGAAASLIWLAVDALSLFKKGDDENADATRDNTRALTASQQAAQKVADELAHRFETVVNNFESVFKEPPAVLQESTLDQAQSAIQQALRAVVPEQRATIKAQLDERMGALRTTFNDIAALQLQGIEAPAELRMQHAENAQAFASLLRQAGGSDKRVGKAAENVFSEASNFLKSGEGAQIQGADIRSVLGITSAADAGAATAMSDWQRHQALQWGAQMSTVPGFQGPSPYTDPGQPASFLENAAAYAGVDNNMAQSGAIVAIQEMRETLNAQMTQQTSELAALNTSINQGIVVRVEPTNFLDSLDTSARLSGGTNLSPGLGR